MTNPPLKGLRALRGDRPQHELARVIGTSQSGFHKFETGAVRLDIYRAKTLADHFGVSIEELL